VLGADHPDTLEIRNNIAGWTGESGEASEALRLFRDLLPDKVPSFLHCPRERFYQDQKQLSAREAATSWISPLNLSGSAEAAFTTVSGGFAVMSH
jgi:hypothetical protein